MRKIGNTKYLLIYFILSLLWMECLFRLLMNDSIFPFGFITAFLFLVALSLVGFTVVSFTYGTFGYIISIFLLGIFSLLYASQFIYFKFFRTYYTVYSAGNANQVLDFWKDIVTILGKNSFWVLLFIVPTIVMIFFGKKLLYFKKLSWRPRFFLIGIVILLHFSAIGTIYVNGKDQHSAYDLYFNSNYPLLSADKLGLLTTMRLDLQRTLTGWTPELAEPPTVVPAFSSVSSQSDLEEEPEEPELEEKEIEEIIEYNTLNIDFDELISQENDEEIINMHEYFSTMEPTAKNEYTGKYEGYNLILLTAESFSPLAVHEEVTPTLYKMIHEGYNFTNFYTPSWEVSTTDGEYVALTSLIPKSGVWSFEESGDNYLPFVMGNQFKELDYKTVAYHNHSYSYYNRHISHPNMGYDYKGLGNGLNVKETWPESDLEMMEKTAPEYMEDEPFHAYYMTVSGHMQYSFSGNVMARKNKALVENLELSEQAKAYIATQIELDKALEHLLKQLEEVGIADNTLIAMSADHYPYGLEDATIDELAGKTVDRNFELYKNHFILYAKDMEPVTIEKPSSSLDIIPTLSNLLGLEYDSRLLMGRDIFSDSDPLVLFLNKSFITDKGKYDSVEQKFISNNGTEVTQDYIDYISSVVENKFYYSTKILDHDYYNVIFDEPEE